MDSTWEDMMPTQDDLIESADGVVADIRSIIKQLNQRHDLKIAEARNQNREQINEERMKHRILAETLRTSYDKTIDILKG